MKRQFRLVHLSDVHLGPLGRAAWRDLANKRLLGYINWKRNRHRVHQRDKIETLLHDIELHEPDHIAVTGDLVNLGLPEEFIAAMNWLEALGSPERVSVVPGNHDAYVRLRSDPGFERWRPYMMTNEAGASIDRTQAGGFPFVKRYGGIALIGFSSGVPTMPFMASGKLGAEQIRRADDILAKARDENLCRVVLMHHPPIVSRSNWYRGLSDAKPFGRVMQAHGTELILHGHWHTQTTNFIDGVDGSIPIIGVPSASAAKPGHKPLARYNIYDFYCENGQWSAHMTGRGLAQPDGDVHTIETTEVDLAFQPGRESVMMAP